MKLSCFFFNFWKPDLGKIIIRQFENNFQHWQDEEETNKDFIHSLGSLRDSVYKI